MRGVISVVLIGTYIVVANVLALRAHRHFRDPARTAWGFDVFRPQLYTPEGQRPRKIAAQFFVWGGIVLIVLLVLLSARWSDH